MNMGKYRTLFVCCWYLVSVYSRSVIDPELYNGDFWEQMPSEWLERLQQVSGMPLSLHCYLTIFTSNLYMSIPIINIIQLF